MNKINEQIQFLPIQCLWCVRATWEFSVVFKEIYSTVFMSDDLRQTEYKILFGKGGNLWIRNRRESVATAAPLFPGSPINSPFASTISHKSSKRFKILHQFHQHALKTFWIQKTWPKHHLKIFCGSNPQKRQYVWWCGGLFDHIMNMSGVSIMCSVKPWKVFSGYIVFQPLHKKWEYFQCFCSSAPIFTL